MRKTEWKGQQCPPRYTERINGGMRQLTIYIDIHQSQTDDGTEEWTATAITLPIGVSDYGTIVSAIVCARYSSDLVQSIICNIGDGVVSHHDELVEFQQWREYAKNEAAAICGIERTDHELTDEYVEAQLEQLLGVLGSNETEVSSADAVAEISELFNE